MSEKAKPCSLILQRTRMNVGSLTQLRYYCCIALYYYNISEMVQKTDRVPKTDTEERVDPSGKLMSVE